jgi:hypothetical protein
MQHAPGPRGEHQRPEVFSQGHYCIQLPPGNLSGFLVKRENQMLCICLRQGTCLLSCLFSPTVQFGCSVSIVGLRRCGGARRLGCILLTDLVIPSGFPIHLLAFWLRGEIEKRGV